MDNSILLDILDRNCLYKYRKELEKDENAPYFKDMREAKEEMLKGLNDEKIEQLNFLLLQHVNYTDFIHWQIYKMILDHGILIGMQLQKAFEDICE